MQWQAITYDNCWAHNALRYRSWRHHRSITGQVRHGVDVRRSFFVCSRMYGLVTSFENYICTVLTNRLCAHSSRILIWCKLLVGTSILDHSRSQGSWETTLHCNVVCHWLGAFTKWSLQSIYYIYCLIVNFDTGMINTFNSSSLMPHICIGELGQRWSS